MQILSLFKRNPFVLPMAVVAALAIFFISEGSYWQALDTIKDLRSISSARLQLERLERSLADAESGQRGFLLTDRPEYLRPYDEARLAVQESLAALDRHFSRSPGNATEMAQLRALALRKLSELDETVRLAQGGRKPAALELTLSGIGKDDMDSLRHLARQLMEAQAVQRDASNLLLDRTLLLGRYGVAALSAVLLVALLLYLLKSEALANAQAEQKRGLQAANDRLESDVAERTAQLTDLTRHLLTAREDERHRLARNLHDDLGSLLTAAKLDAARIRSRLGNGAPETQERLADLVAKLDSGISLGRRIIEDLRPSTLTHLGLGATLEILLRDFALNAGVEVHCALEPVRLEPAAELVVYRVVQEAITNLSKYAQAKNVWLSLRYSNHLPGQVELRVRDDGLGFDTRQPTPSAYGLLGMRFRIEAIDGTLRVNSQPGAGTEITVRLPALAVSPADPLPA